MSRAMTRTGHKGIDTVRTRSLRNPLTGFPATDEPSRHVNCAGKRRFAVSGLLLLFDSVHETKLVLLLGDGVQPTCAQCRVHRSKCVYLPRAARARPKADQRQATNRNISTGVIANETSRMSAPDTGARRAASFLTDISSRKFVQVS